MIKTSYSTTFDELNKRFCAEASRKICYFARGERDSYTGELTLSGEDELDGTIVTLWIHEDEYSVDVTDEDGNIITEESHTSLPDAIEAYDKLAKMKRLTA